MNIENCKKFYASLIPTFWDKNPTESSNKIFEEMQTSDLGVACLALGIAITNDMLRASKDSVSSFGVYLNGIMIGLNIAAQSDNPEMVKLGDALRSHIEKFESLQAMKDLKNVIPFDRKDRQ